ncbi:MULTISPECIES: MetS family NSS transporter small subunit [unclassified Pseudodesulfovibrio]|nr:MULTISPECIES: MetS family NSS transporter small subunit [unclassified Pseudodesulfovibrio]MCJ2164870.1 MetS family NSS transporter small subunit [Pseudodesulfovibrio sp. S3-i]RWU03762.1 MetS family NSS transporter small subunit [Pseudodesulfovibrio sp. S3]
MSTSAIIMMCVGLGVTWGGAVFCIRLAMKKQGR